MRYAVIIFLLCFILLVQFIFANFMRKVAVRKGYGDDAHAWAMCFWLGIAGGIYVMALPDLIQQSQNQQMIELLKDVAKGKEVQQ
ncbi:MAG: hypothetical protein DBY23_05710 [Bacillota bacterium]|nr:MAG: hypothetical protein DBY23_05710 [Bacillota bacterium]